MRLALRKILFALHYSLYTYRLDKTRDKMNRIAIISIPNSSRCCPTAGQPGWISMRQINPEERIHDFPTKNPLGEFKIGS